MRIVGSCSDAYNRSFVCALGQASCVSVAVRARTSQEHTRPPLGGLTACARYMDPIRARQRVLDRRT